MVYFRITSFTLVLCEYMSSLSAITFDVIVAMGFQLFSFDVNRFHADRVESTTGGECRPKISRSMAAYQDFHRRRFVEV